VISVVSQIDTSIRISFEILPLASRFPGDLAESAVRTTLALPEDEIVELEQS